MSTARQLALLWAVVALLCLTGLLLTPRIAPELLPHVSADLPACPVKSLAGLPCPTCGATRATLALSDLDLWRALALNPLVSLAWLTLVGGGLVAGVVVLAGGSLPALPRRLSPALRWGAVALVAANWLYLVERGI